MSEHNPSEEFDHELHGFIEGHPELHSDIARREVVIDPYGIVHGLLQQAEEAPDRLDLAFDLMALVAKRDQAGVPNANPSECTTALQEIAAAYQKRGDKARELEALVLIPVEKDRNWELDELFKGLDSEIKVKLLRDALQ